MDTTPAFPIPAYRDTAPDPRGNTSLSHEKQDGMTLRDYFAAEALRSIID